jgi:hypothetical protein
LWIKLTRRDARKADPGVNFSCKSREIIVAPNAPTCRWTAGVVLDEPLPPQLLPQDSAAS